MIRRLLTSHSVEVATIVVLCAILLIAFVNSSREPRAYAFFAVSRIRAALDELRRGVDLFEEAVPTSLVISHGVASGEPGADNVVIWARASRAAVLRVRYDVDAGFGSPMEAAPVQVGSATDYTARVKLVGLRPATTYSYEAWFEESHGAAAPRSPSERGTFRTAPSLDAHEPVSFVFGGDLGGGGYCRGPEAGYTIFEAMRAVSPRFFVAMGDMIYADDACPGDGPSGRRNVPGGFPAVAGPGVSWSNQAEVQDIYSRHWRYNRADPHFQRFLRQVPMFSIWDDHEILNDSGGSWAYWRTGTEHWAGYSNLVRAGRDAFFNFAPMTRRTDDPDRIYRAVRWGADVELFLLDTRSYRSRNDMIDAPGAGKTMLGVQQLAWLKESLANSTATWKMIVSSVPLSAPTGGPTADAFGNDGWAKGSTWLASSTGFEQELWDLAAFLDGRRMQNVVFLTGDLHRPLIIRYEVDPNRDGDRLIFHEVVAGPLSASPRGEGEPDLDPFLRPRVLYHGGGRMNFGFVQIARRPEGGAAHFVAEIRGEDGELLPGSRLDLSPSMPETR